MTDVLSGASVRLYSQTDHDDRGNFEYQGDLYRAGEPLASIAARIGAHLASHFPDARFSIRTESFAGRRKITAEILDAAQDLTLPDVQESWVTGVRDQMERFGVTRSNPLQDFHSCAFFCEVRIGQSYWAALAQKREPKNPVRSLVSLSAFRKQVRAGDSLKLIDAPAGHRALGTTRTITHVRSADLILDGKSYLSLPRASAFACDGERVRIAIGSEREPDAHLLYLWHRQAA